MEITPELLNKLIKITLIICAGFVMMFILSLRKSDKYHSIMRAGYKNLDRITKKSRAVSYEAISNTINSKGLKIHFGEWMTPVAYIIAIIICCLIGALLGSLIFAIPGAIIGLVVGLGAMPLLSKALNDSDEKKMVPEIAIVYNTLRVQIHAGVHIQDALVSCYHFLDDGRLKKGLKELADEVKLTGDFDTALDNFESKFSFEPVHTLCMIIEQGQKSGQMEALLGDLTKQVDNMQSALLMQRKGTLDRISTFCIMAVLGSTLGFILWTFVSNLIVMAIQI